MSKLKGRKPKIKMRSYGEGVELPVLKSKQGLFKKPEFYLEYKNFTDTGHGDYSGQDSSKLHGPSQRAIKGKGKKSGEVYVGVTSNPDETQTDVSYLENVSPVPKKGYPEQTYMQKAVDKWKSNTPLMQTGGEEEIEKIESRGPSKVEYEQTKTRLRDEKDIEQEKINKIKAEQKAAAEAKKIKKEDRRAKATDVVQAIGRAMEAVSGTSSASQATDAVAKLKAKRESEAASKKTKKKTQAQIAQENAEGNELFANNSTATVTSPMQLQNLGPELETQKKGKGIGTFLGGAALGGLAVHLVNKKKNKENS